MPNDPTLNQYQLEILDNIDLSADDRQFLLFELLVQNNLLRNPPTQGRWSHTADSLHTIEQVGHLAGIMGLDDDDRYFVVGVLVGFPITSTKDERITRWMHNRLIEYYLKGNGHEFNKRLLGFI